MAKKTKILKSRKVIKKNGKPKRPRKLGLAKYIQPYMKARKPRPDESNQIPEMKNSNKTTVKQYNLASKSKSQTSTLLERCKEKMSSSILRLMDETLYNSDTTNVHLDREKFLAYHEAYATVCEKWPTKPIDFIVKFIKKRLVVKRPISKIKFADVGCGRLPLLKKKLPSKAKVVSFDLVSAHDDITEANMENLPLDDSSINCAVFSLSLMATNLGNIILEAKRILKVGGSMLIVEVTSRFESQERKFSAKVEKLGFKQKSTSLLKPNGYFTFFHFTKVDSITDYAASNLNIKLKPCVYKAR